MLDHLIIEPMREELLLWRCLHSGMLSAENLDDPALDIEIDWSAIRARNVPLLQKLTRTYGACAIMARDGDQVVAMVRFYPKVLCRFVEAGGVGLCLQQRPPAGPEEDLADSPFPPLQEMTDKTLFVHCLMIASPQSHPDRYKRKGLATRMVRRLIDWAGERGWRAIEATAYEDLPYLYAISGIAGKRFWEKLGFSVVHRDIEPGLSGQYLEAARRDAVAAGIPAEDAANRYTMRLDLPQM